MERYLKLLTFMPLPRITEIMSEHEQDPSKRVAQHVLAHEVVAMIHGPTEAAAAEKNHRLLFGEKLPEQSSAPDQSSAPPQGDMSNSLNPKAPQTNSTNMPSVNVILPASLVYHQPIARLLYSAGLVSSRSEGNRLAANQGAYIGSRADGSGRMRDDLSFTPVKLFNPYQTKDFIVDGDLIILRVGKWKVKVVKIVSDEEFERRGLSAPGWKDDKTADVEEEKALPPKKKDNYLKGWRRLPPG